MNCEFIAWCALKAEAQAAWAQALLSVLAIAVAILVPALQHRREVKRQSEAEQAEARSIAMRLLPLIIRWKGNIEAAIHLNYQEYINSVGTVHFWERLVRALNQDTSTQNAQAESHRLASARSPVQAFLYNLTLAHRTATTAFESKAKDPSSGAEHANALYAQLKETLVSAENAIAAMDQLFHLTQETGDN